MRNTAILAAALAAAVAVPAVAATETSTSASVRFTDLDLTTQAGQDQLQSRIDNAARAACGLDAANTGSRLPSSEARRCVEKAKAQVNQQVAELIARDKSRG